MRVILDANVFVSGIFFTGPPYQILKAWQAGKLKLVISPEILEEYQRVGVALAEQFPSIDLQGVKGSGLHIS
jgi:predicted nucleic acid-binding protein